MGHALQALVTTLPIARRAMLQNREARAFSLPDGFAIIPLFEELLETFAEPATPPAAEWVDPLDGFIAELSRDGVVVHLETEYFGGVGSQTATAWNGGRVAYGPVTSESPGPINEALRLLGVQAVAVDEFDWLGLGRVRHTEDWLREGRPIAT